MEASSHLVLDNCLLRPIPLISHVNLHRRLVCLGSKLTNMHMVGKGERPYARQLTLLPRAPIWHRTLQHTPTAATTPSPATGLKLPCKNKARNPHPTPCCTQELGIQGLPCPAAPAGAHLHCKDSSYRLVVADRVFHVAAVAELAHRHDAPAGLASTCTEPDAGRFDLPEDAVSPGWFSLLGTAGHRGGHLLPGRGAAGSTPNCLPLALQHVGAGDAAHRGAQLCAAAGTDLHWHQHKSCVPSLMSPAQPTPALAWLSLPLTPQPCLLLPARCPTCCHTCWCPHQT